MNGLKRVILKAGKDQSVRRFHPWVFSGAVASTTGFPAPGEMVEVVSHQGECLGTGHYAEGSIAVRLFAFGQQQVNESFWTDKIRKAFQLRQHACVADGSHNEVMRLVHAEGDGLPGLIIDLYGGTAVIQCHDPGMHALMDTWIRALQEVLGDRLERVYDKSAITLARTSTSPVTDGYRMGSHGGEIVREHGHRFRIDWIGGQKTGFFIDQRENRKLVGSLAQGRKVLNTFCYTGGFSVYALAAGALGVHSLDSSQKALDLTEENVSLNGFDASRHQVIRADAVGYLNRMGREYDFIVLDPPAFAKHLSARHKAVQGYRRINEAALRSILPGGILCTFSCSQAVDAGLFRGAVLAAAIDARREVRILHQVHQPADHPVSIYHPEGEYLKGLILEVR